jgi:acyl-CoA dehydrogenase
MLVAAEALGIGRAALRRAVRYGNEREVFGRPIGMNQGLQFPLADSLARLDAAELVLRKATWLYDNGKACARGRPTPPSTCAPMPGSTRPTARCRSTAAWATRRSTTSPGTSGRPG